MALPTIGVKRLQFSFRLLPQPGQPQPVFPTTQTPDLFLTQLRGRCTVVKQGGQGMSSVQLAIYGMNLSDMNQLSTLGMKVQLVQKSTVTVKAADFNLGSGRPIQFYTVVNNATVFVAYADIGGSSQVPFRVVAHSGGYEAVQNIPPTSFSGPFEVAQAAKLIADAAGLNFEDNGVKVTLRNRTYPGTVRQQAMQLCKEANVSWVIDDSTFAIWPKNGSRNLGPFEVSADTGMVGYPSFTDAGVFVKSVYNPLVRYGSKIRVNSIIQPANKEWVISTLQHDLDTGVPGGQWFTGMTAFDAAFGRPPTIGGGTAP